MNYNNPVKPGQMGFLKGLSREDNPCSIRTSANAYAEWDAGWVKQSNINCNGIEVSVGEFSGCAQSNGDCPSCGK